MSDRPLKILIVEDTPSKKRRMFERFKEHASVFGDPELVVNTNDAIRRLQEKEYDLLVLDLLIPRDNISDPEEQNSIELLNRIDARQGGINRPRHIISISSSAAISVQAQDFHRSRPWGCIRYQDDSNQCLDDLENIGRWIHDDLHRQQNLSECDAFVVTALDEPEMQAIENQIENLGPYVPLDSVQLVRFCEIISNGRKLKVGLAFAARMGPVASAILCTKILEKMRPRLILMAGICGGISKSAQIGDVIAGDPTWDWQSGKYVESDSADFEFAPHQIYITTDIRNGLIKMKKDAAFWRTFAELAVKHKLELPKLLLGPLATGASVIADEKVTRRIKEQQNKNVIGVDMESYAVYAATAAAAHPTRFLSLKSVCDKANVDKNDDYQSYAADVSAKAVVYFLECFGAEFTQR